MKKSLLYLVLGISTCMLAQNTPIPSSSFHPISFPKTDCINDDQRSNILQEIENNKQSIIERNPEAFQHRTTVHPLFEFPIRPKTGFEDYGYYSLFNQVDHNLTPNGNLTDYNCGERTYDWGTGNHKGTDYVVWPYPWKKMEDDVMEIIAAAPGVIVQKKEGNFDRNCVNNGNPNWNGIILEHADGSRSWYWHFKSGSVTTKSVGDSVATGEYLGRAGSSGSSDIPHVHFEVHDSTGALIDPYAGPCNNMNSESWWASQPAYFNPEILTLSTHGSDSYDTECGIVENTYEQLDFIPGEIAYFRIFYRDLQTNARTSITVAKPDGSLLYDYDFDSPWPDYTVAYAQWNFPIDNTSMDGVHTITVEFGGQTYTTIFGVNTDLGTEDLASEFSIYPNPTSGVLNIVGNSPIEKVVIYDFLGRNVLETKPLSKNIQMDLNNLKASVYFAEITSEGKRTVRKIVKK